MVVNRTHDQETGITQIQGRLRIVVGRLDDISTLVTEVDRLLNGADRRNAGLVRGVMSGRPLEERRVVAGHQKEDPVAGASLPVITIVAALKVQYMQ